MIAIHPINPVDAAAVDNLTDGSIRKKRKSRCSKKSRKISRMNWKASKNASRIYHRSRYLREKEVSKVPGRNPRGIFFVEISSRAGQLTHQRSLNIIILDRLYFDAKVAQLVEHNLAKVRVASSNLVFRFFLCPKSLCVDFRSSVRYNELRACPTPS